MNNLAGAEWPSEHLLCNDPMFMPTIQLCVSHPIARIELLPP